MEQTRHFDDLELLQHSRSLIRIAANILPAPNHAEFQQLQKIMDSLKLSMVELQREGLAHD